MNFHIQFLNSDFSFNIAQISAKFLEDVLYNRFEGILSQNSDLGPPYFLMLCRKFVTIYFHNFLRFPS